MLNEAQLVAHAEQAAGEPVLVQTEARRSIPGEIVSQRGLLAATRSALVFVVDELLRPGPASVFRAADLLGHARKVESFSGSLQLDTRDGRIEFAEIQKDRLWALVYACGLTQTEEGPPPSPTPASLTPEPVPVLPAFSLSPQSSTPEPTPLPSLFAAPWTLEKVSLPPSDNLSDPLPGADNADQDDEDDEDEDADESEDKDEDADESEDEDEDEDEDADESEDPAAEAHKEKVQEGLAKVTAAPHSDEPKSPPVEPKMPARPEAVGGFFGFWLLLVLIAGVAIAYWLADQESHRFWGLSPARLLSALKDARGLLSTGFVLAAVVAVIGGACNALGCRPPVFWSTLPAFLLVCAGLFGMRALLPDPKSLEDTIPSAEAVLSAVRMANAAPLLPAGVLAYLFGIPLVALWVRALCTNPSDRPAAMADQAPQPGSAGTTVSMLIAAVAPAVFGCLYFQRGSHLLPVTGLALAMIAPSALLAWQGSRLPAHKEWDLGGSPAAFAVQGLFVYFTYWIVVRQLQILDALPNVTDSPQTVRALLDSLDALEITWVAIDKPLLAAVIVAQLGVIAAASIGHDAIVAIDPEQKRSTVGWLLSGALLLLLGLLLTGLHDELRSRYADLIPFLRNLATTRTPG